MRISFQGRIFNYHSKVRVFTKKELLVFRDEQDQLQFPLQIGLAYAQKDIIRYIKSCYRRGFKRLNLNHYLCQIPA
ncbi:hypothetical protein AVI51_15160 [Piscirickettsia salmonis]|uniref:Radical SAM protein n=1 Tax=Piscirickettsia salmonis TaxID=1238 RepID=A0A095BFA7_PISSA|nr:hypothetical protein [Piscirickettsia salmonis]RNC77899.1 hypothetical protein DA717_07690 [Piscirickettsiaceae bacterium NZ-RLO2]ALA24372.1 radical SAM protein [Piscirickettsia salmonis]ALB22048.1 radical SAM protein [Piscirickettsia salmonis]ALT18226.1 hypothetical protein PSLF89_04730 [Piscirickettsia salmonis LF-89 = ATCC VR-1361]ALY02186.1 hypothetical protein AWE47_04395 [Piscirickettsia salmonis]